jgi:hypothetical protein
MTSQASVFPAHHSGKTKYYGLIFIAILAVPIGVLFYYFTQGTLIFAVGMSTILFGVLAVLSYFTLKSGSLAYQVTPNELQITFGVLKKRVPYIQIAKVEKVELSLSLRLFGASLPGFHWGLFTTNVGRAHVYGSQINGEYVVVTLANGEKIALSPKNSDQFMVALISHDQMFSGQTMLEIAAQKQMQRKAVYLQVTAVTAAYVAFLGYFVWVYLALPQTVPVHFGFDGVVNRWADKSELLWLAGIASVFPILNGVLTLKFGKYERSMVIVLGAIFVAVIAVFVYSINMIAAAA